MKAPLSISIVLIWLTWTVDGQSNLGNKTSEGYTINLLNKSGQKLDDIFVDYKGKLLSRPCMLVSGGIASDGPCYSSLPPEVIVHIRDKDGDRTVQVSLTNVPTHFDGGTLYFVVNNNGTVEVVPIKGGDVETETQLRRSILPH